MSTNTCQHCSAPSSDAFLCPRCAKTLRGLLADLPWWIDRLAEAAVGDVQMSDPNPGSSHSVYVTSYPVNGEHNVAHYLVCFPGNDDDPPDDKLLARRHANARREALAAGGVNEHSSTLIDTINNTLTTIIRDLCEHRGIEQPTFGRGTVACAKMTHWLQGNLGAICADEGAGRTYEDVHSLVGDAQRDGRIGRAVNRPIPVRDLGRCPTWNEETRKNCGASLRARADAIEVYCRHCRTTHNTDRLQLLAVNDLARAKVTVDEILQLNRILPEDYRIAERTLRRWRNPSGDKEPKLRIKGYLRPCMCGHGSKYHERHRGDGCRRCRDACPAHDGREVINRHSEDDEPLYLWEDVRRLRAEQWKVPTG